MNILDYIKWRSDLTFEERDLNEIDSLIFTILSYENFEEILPLNTSRSISECAQLFFSIYEEKDLRTRKTLTNRSYEVLKHIANTNRYKNLILSNYVNEIDVKQDVQFSALTITYKDKWKYIAFRGTDDTFTGWKEDFMMTYKEEVLSQKKAVEYLNKVFNEDSLLTKLLHKMTYYVGGHSKGGILAMYACAHVPTEIQTRIKRIDNFDGPGFDKRVWEKESIQKIIPVMNTYIPTSSLFGRLFQHEEKVTIIKSHQMGLLQHDGFNWIVEIDHFDYENEVSLGSVKAVNKLNDLLNGYNYAEREEIIESLFDIFERLEIYTFNDLLNIDLSKLIVALKDIVELDSKQRKVIIDFIGIIWDVTDISNEVKSEVKNFKNELKKLKLIEKW